MNMRITNLIVLLLLFSANISFGQKKQVIRLKNGSTIKGRIIEQEGGKIKVKTYDNSIWVFEESEVSYFKPYKTQYQPNKGFLNMTSFGLMFGREHPNVWGESIRQAMFGISLQSFNGFQLDKSIALGLSLSFDGYLSAAGDAHIPIALGARGFFGKNSQFFYGFDIGPSIALTNSKDSKVSQTLMFQPIIGFKMPSKSKNALFFQTGFKKQKFLLTETTPWSNWRSEKELTYNRWFVSIGLFI